MRSRAVVFANGSYPSAVIVKRTVRNAGFILCADGGANHALKFRVKPDHIIGDFDSIRPATRRRFGDVARSIVPDQYSTDLEKAIRYCIARGFTRVDILGATGDRLDHTFGSMGCFRRFGGKIAMRLIDRAGILEPAGRHIRLKTRPGETVSLIPITRCSGITTTNLLYPLSAETLENGVRDGISNRATAGTVSVTVGRGVLLIYRFHSNVP